jgi:hypothetical protein
VQTVPQSPSEHIAVDDVSVTPSSLRSSHGSRGNITHFSPVGESISDETSFEVIHIYIIVWIGQVVQSRSCPYR